MCKLIFVRITVKAYQVSARVPPFDLRCQCLLIDKNIAVEDIAEFEKDLFDYIESAHPDITKSISETKDLTKENEEALKTALGLYVEKFLQSK